MFPLFNFRILENSVTKIEAIVSECLKLEELNEVFLVDIVHNGTKLQIFVDTDNGINFRTCQRLSRQIEAVLDETLLLGEKYTLEVSSPGISRPLKFLRQYHRNIGREIIVSLKDGNIVEGTLKNVENDLLTVTSPGKNKKETINHEIRFDAVESSKISISFGKKKMKK